MNIEKRISKSFVRFVSVSCFFLNLLINFLLVVIILYIRNIKFKFKNLLNKICFCFIFFLLLLVFFNHLIICCLVNICLKLSSFIVFRGLSFFVFTFLLYCILYV